MEGADTVDVSWLHHSQKDHLVRTKSAPTKFSDKTKSKPLSPTDEDKQLAVTTSEDAKPTSQTSSASKSPPTSAPTPPKKDNPPQDSVAPKSPTPPSNTSSSPNATCKASPRPIPTPRRNSWISSLSSKFSSSSTPPSQTQFKDDPISGKQQPQNARPDLPNPFGAAYSPGDRDKDAQSGPFTSGSPRSGHPSFFHNAFRKLSSSGGGGLGKLATQGTVCPRRVMNVDPDRDRCKIPELKQANLRRVAFCVDVEIAGTSRRSDSDDSPPANGQANGRRPPNIIEQGKSSLRRKSKATDKGEGATLKNAHGHTPEASQDPALNTSKEELPPEPTEENGDKPLAKELTRKQEKKKRSEEERKERKERKRRQAEENGTVPLHFNMDDSSKTSSPHRFQKGQDQPTTDPVRIYRRCCQLRESGVLKKLVEQISSPSSALAESPGTVAVLDLTNFPMNLTDITTFSDWLAIVPVRKLILQNCGLTDEAVRVILAGLLSTKTVEATRLGRGFRQSKTDNTITREERFGAIEKLSFKDNPKIGPEGWRHIGLFIHMSRSLKGIDLSGIPFPRPRSPSNSPPSLAKPAVPIPDIAAIFSDALEKRLAGNRLEELVLSECNLRTDDVEKVCNAARVIGLRRLGLANNLITRAGLESIIKYLQAGDCEGLDLGGNDLNDYLDLLASALQKTIPLSALSLADCSVTPDTLCNLLQALTLLPNFRFIDLSHNHALFTTQPGALATLRRYLPKLLELRRIHLADTCLTSEYTIALAEILPDCPKLCHINLLENPAIQALAAAKDPMAQEEACALYASIMAAVRVSRTLMAVDVDVPTPDNNEIVKALASQIVAYSLRNLERGELVEAFSPLPDSSAAGKEDVPIPDILAHLVGHAGDDEDKVVDDLDLARDEDYVIGGTGVAKALGVCLGNADYSTAEHTGELSPPPSGTSTPLRRLSLAPTKKPRDMSKNLLNSARRIRARLQQALVREDRAGNDYNYRRLQFLDMTLQKMIQRFEDAFPDTRLPDAGSLAGSVPLADSQASFDDDLYNQQDHNTLAPVEQSERSQSPEEGDTALEDDDPDRYAVRLSRTSSNTSLHSRALMFEEGRVHRLGQRLSRDILQSDLDNPDATSSHSPLDDAHVPALRERLEELRSNEAESGTDSNKPIGELDSSLEELLELQKRDPNALSEFKESQIVALISAGLRSPGE